MTAKDFNHYVPAVLLKNWDVTGSDKHGNVGTGVHYYSPKTQSIEFQLGRGPRRYAFAARPKIHVAELDSKRRDDVEDWFAERENRLEPLIRSLLQKDLAIFGDPERVPLALQCILSLAYRSRADLERLKSSISSQLRDETKTPAERDAIAQRAMLESILSRIEDEARSVTPTSVNMFYSDTPCFIVGDHPTVERAVPSKAPRDPSTEKMGDMCFEAVLAARMAVQLFRPVDGQSRVQVFRVLPAHVDAINYQQALSTVDWLVGAPELLQHYGPIIGSPAHVEHHRAIVVERISSPKSWRFERRDQ